MRIAICDDDKIFATELEGFILEFAKRNKWFKYSLFSQRLF